MRRDQLEHAIAAAANVADTDELVVVGSQAILGSFPETAKAPAGWEERLVRVPIPPRRGSSRAPVALCLEPHDLVLAKCVAGREHDWEFAREALRAGLVARAELLRRVEDLPVAPELREHVRAQLAALPT